MRLRSPHRIRLFLHPRNLFTFLNHTRRNLRPIGFSTLLISALAFSACEPVEPNKTASSSARATKDGKIAITTSSEEARKEFLAGRDLSEKLRITDSISHFDKAISLDPNFALAELNRANVSPTAKEFFDHLKKAVTLADKASDGERMLIQAAEAGANANPTKQKEILEKLVAAYPNDERAHFNLGGYYFGQQDFTQAITHYKKATELAPDYSTAFNILGYAYRQNEAYSDAENAFKKYIELIPNDPNPYDSYAELLLKMGRFDEAITQYNKALAIRAKLRQLSFRNRCCFNLQGEACRRAGRVAEDDAEGPQRW